MNQLAARDALLLWSGGLESAGLLGSRSPYADCDYGANACVVYEAEITDPDFFSKACTPPGQRLMLL